MKTIQTIRLDEKKEKILLTDVKQQATLAIEPSFKYTITGILHCEKNERVNPAIVLIMLDGKLVSKELSEQMGLIYTDKYGALTYINPNEEGAFELSFVAPRNAKNITLLIRRWNNQNDIYIDSLLEVKKSELIEVIYDKLNSLNTLLPKFEYQLNTIEKNNFSQIESLMNIHSVLNLKFPLPKMRGWPISPDFAELIMKEILIKKPKYVVEFGSGVSTLIIGYALAKNNKGILTSFEHDMYYGNKTLETIKLHKLEKYVNLVHAPIKELRSHKKVHKWYTVKTEDILHKIDMLIVDGPPANTDDEARYPALPYLIKQMSPTSIVIMDDAIREDEQNICKQWVEMYPEYSSEYIGTEKGALILRRNQ